MADWPAAADGQRYTGFVTTQSGVLGTTVTLPPVAQTKLVSFTTIIASTTIAASGIFVAIPTQTGAAARYFVDIAVGAAGFETIIIPNLYLTYPAATRAGQEVFFPITIPTGTRISARIQSTLAATAGLQINVRLMASGLSVTPSRSIVTTWGDTPATTNGTTIPAPGAINTYGSLVELKVVPYTSGGTYSAAVLATSQPANLVGYWRMGEATGQNLQDSTTNNNVGTVNGAPTGVTGALQNDLNAAINFPNNAANFYSVPVAGSIATIVNTLSINVWINSTTTTVLQRIVTTNTGGFDLLLGASGNPAFSQSGGVFCMITNPNVVSPNVWTMVTAVKNGAIDRQMYINGQNMALLSSQDATLVVSGPNMHIGRHVITGADPFSGVIDELALWNTPLSAAQIATLYNTGLQYIPGTPATNPYPVEEIIVNVQSPSVTSANIRGVLSICIGPAGATEIAAIPISANSAVLTPGQNFLGPFPCHIPANTNVWGKLRWSSLTAPVPSIEVTIYGVS